VPSLEEVNGESTHQERLVISMTQGGAIFQLASYSIVHKYKIRGLFFDGSRVEFYQIEERLGRCYDMLTIF
jgi:hypothetical protein